MWCIIILWKLSYLHNQYPFVTISVTIAGVAQLVEHSLRKGQVDGSNPPTSFLEKLTIWKYQNIQLQI